MVLQRYVDQHTAFLQGAVEGQHGFQVARLGADPQLPLARIRGQRQQRDILARQGFEGVEQAFPGAAKLRRDAPHFRQVDLLFALLRRRQAGLPRVAHPQLALGLLQLGEALSGLFFDPVVRPQHHRPQHQRTGQQSPAKRALPARLEIQIDLAHLSSPP
ncbi:hypothetical protein FQZ97_1047620 [compost metagenome]